MRCETTSSRAPCGGSGTWGSTACAWTPYTPSSTARSAPSWPSSQRPSKGQAAALGRQIHLFAESDRNSLAYLRSRELGGCGIDAQWCDDFHHALHALLTGERAGYYRDFGELEQLADAFRAGFVYTGQYSSYRRRRHGVPSDGVPPRRFVACAQNHDQVGNRQQGERLASLVSMPQLRLAAGAVLLSPFLPLLFMGEEHGERAPFLYFVDHRDPELREAVRRGRREELAAFAWRGETPDPAAEETFIRSRPASRPSPGSREERLRDWYRELLRLRRELPALGAAGPGESAVTADAARRWIALHHRRDGDEAVVALSFADAGIELPWRWAGAWRLRLDSADPEWGGAGGDLPSQASEGVTLTLPPWTVAVYERVRP
ncbi:MAG TPA: DUF3459 domain-containing protein [Thermoanaerobaculia bacterium]|nr:DUF3459 domain-containing protein [Thermoanaerobaculia bacterium]